MTTQQVQDGLHDDDRKGLPDPPQSHRGLWNELERCEFVASHALTERLATITHGMSLIFEAGTEAPTLRGTRYQEPDVRLAALFMKRALTDLRALWILLCKGYTAPAASIAAALYEHSLTIDIVAGSTRYANELAESPHGDVPWSAKELCKRYAAALQERENLKSSERHFDFEAQWRCVYAPYLVLCKIKHPTARAAMHEASATLRPDGSYVVTVTPDLRDDDWTFKTTIAGLVAVRLGSAIEAFISALGECEHCDRRARLLNDIRTGRSEVVEAMFNAKGRAPFSTADIAKRLGHPWNPKGAAHT